AAANGLPGAVEESEKLDRQERLMELQARISEEKLAARVGTAIEVLIDEVQGDRAVARSRGDAPEIDGVVRIGGARGLVPGDRVRVRVTGADVHDLDAEYVGTPVELSSASF